MTTSGLRWTDASVLRFAEREDPVHKMENTSRASVLAAVEQGWNGPPFDPIELATIRRIRVRPNASIPDARVLSRGHTFEIQYNPNRPRARVNFSIAHEIAHTFFPDCAEVVRNRATSRHTQSWQLEMLCNIGAAELLMPFHSFSLDGPASIERLMKLRQKYQVSAEAVLIRFTKLASSPLACFAASRMPSSDEAYRIDYCISPSASGLARNLSGRTIPSSTVLNECVAIGTTSKGLEDWIPGEGTLQIEAVALPPYPSSSYLRVVGFLSPSTAVPTVSTIMYRHGDATHFIKNSDSAILHVVNDRARKWGPYGFASALRSRYPDAYEDYAAWTADWPQEHTLGAAHVAHLPDNRAVVSLVAQTGYGASKRPRLRYGALDTSLRVASERLRGMGIDSIQMPRIGSGQAGGHWPVIAGIIHERFVSRRFEVRVFDLP